MANNINCTCGHSWSKASSSKKDMYVCHMCGKDNTMEDGGWLNKFEQGGMNLEQKDDNYGIKPNPNDVQASVGPDFVGLGYDTTGRNYSPAWGGQFQSGGFLEPISYKLPSRYRIPYAEPSSELAMSIGGEGGEPAYLIPSFKGGKELKDPIAEYKKTGEHLGGPFKTWQEADKWEQEIRHPYVEKGKPIPTPLKRWGDMAMGGSMPGAVGFTYARTAGSAPSNGKYAKKTKASAQNGKGLGSSKQPTYLTFDTNDPAFQSTEANDFSVFDPNNFQNVKKNLTDYMSSPLYLDRLSKSIPNKNAANKAQQDRLKNVENLKLNPLGVNTNYSKGVVNLGFDDFNDNAAVVHEMSHGVAPTWYGNKNRFLDNIIHSVFQKDQDLRNKELSKLNIPLSSEYISDIESTYANSNYKPFQDEHYRPKDKSKTQQQVAANETYGDLNAIRQLLFENKVTDKFGQELTPDIWNKALEDRKILNNPLLKRMKLKFSDEDIIKMNNEVAKNNSMIPIDRAQNGKEMKFYQEGLDFKPNSIAQDGKAVKDETMVKKPITTSSIVDSKKQALQKYAREMAQKEQPTLSNFDPLLNTSARKQLYKETEQNKLSNQLLKGADVATDLMQLGNFVPNPVGQLVGNIGNVAGGWLDAYQAYDAYNKGDYGDAAINLASVAIPMQLGSSTFRRNSKYLQPGQPLHFLKGNKRVNYIEPFTNVKGMTNKSLMANRALLGTLGAETAYDSYQDGGAIVDPMGQWAHPGEVTIIPSTDITMEGVDYPVLGISDTGDQQMMYPGEDYQFDGDYVTEYPMMQDGGWLNKFDQGKAPSDATRVSAPIKPLTKKEQKENVRINKQTQKNTEEYNKAIIADRKSKRETKGDVNVPGSFNISEKLKLSNILPESWTSPGGAVDVFDEYLNPGAVIGPLADSLGESIAARSPEGVATTLAMTLGAGALGFDPLGSSIKSAKKIGKHLTEKTALKRFSKFSGVDDLGMFTQKGSNKYYQLGEPKNLETNNVKINNKLKDWIEENVEEFTIKPEPKPDFGSMTIDKAESENYLKNYQKNLQSNYNRYLKDRKEAIEFWNEEVNILGKDPKDMPPMLRDLINDPNYKNFYLDLEPDTKHIAQGLVSDYSGTDINANLVDKYYLPKGGRALVTKDSGEGLFKKSADNFGDYKQVKPWEVFNKNFFIRKNKNGGWLSKFDTAQPGGTFMSKLMANEDPTLNKNRGDMASYFPEIRKAQQKPQNDKAIAQNEQKIQKQILAEAVANAKGKQATVKQDNRTSRQKEIAEQQLVNLTMDEARGNSPFTQTLSSFTPTGSNEAAGQIAAENIGQMTPMMGATRLFTTAMDPKNNPYGIGQGNGFLANTLGTLGMIGDAFDVGSVFTPALGSAIKQQTPLKNISEIETISPDVKLPWKQQELPGLHLSSTMEGGPISKIVEPKTGLINVDQALGIIAKESGGASKASIIQKALGKDVPKKMDYNDFRKTVQDQLIPLDREVVSTFRSGYGTDQIGYTKLTPNNRKIMSDRINNTKEEILKLEKEGNIENQDYLDILKANLQIDLKDYNNLPLENQTIRLSNKDKFGRGSDAHDNPAETLGHIHFIRDAESPDVLTMTQMQSDAFQGTHRSMPKSLEEAGFSLQSLENIVSQRNNVLESLKKQKEELLINKADKETISQIDEEIDTFTKLIEDQNAFNKFNRAEVENFAQKSLLDKNHQERYLQELVDYAGKRGDVNKVRVPTSETAAKVQGYKGIEAEEIIKRYNEEIAKNPNYTKEITERATENEIKLINDVLNGKKKGMVYEPEAQTILKKYTEQPKVIKKLFGVEPKIVTDSKGNTWYEFDIPSKFKGGKGEIKAFKDGGWLTKYK